MKTTLVFLMLLIATPASAKTCNIMVAKDHAFVEEILRHENGHANGWKHPDQKHGPNGPKAGYRAPQVPKKYDHPYPGQCFTHFVTTKEAIDFCGSFGCQWFD